MRHACVVQCIIDCSHHHYYYFSHPPPTFVTNTNTTATILLLLTQLSPLLLVRCAKHELKKTRVRKKNNAHAPDKHFHLFPRAVGQAMHRFDVEEFHLSFTQGRWHYERWGTPHCPAPVGAELYTWFNNSNSSNTNCSSSTNQVDQRWKGLVNTLSGTFCASLNFLDTTVSSHATGSVSGSESHGPLFRYGTLSREIVCTENLTPFKSLMPSRGKVISCCDIGSGGSNSPQH